MLRCHWRHAWRRKIFRENFTCMRDQNIPVWYEISLAWHKTYMCFDWNQQWGFEGDEFQKFSDLSVRIHKNPRKNNLHTNHEISKQLFQSNNLLFKNHSLIHNFFYYLSDLTVSLLRWNVIRKILRTVWSVFKNQYCNNFSFGLGKGAEVEILRLIKDKLLMGKFDFRWKLMLTFWSITSKVRYPYR